MNEKTDMTTRESTEMQERRESVQPIRPPVNIFEDAEGITLEADMPGVSKDRLQIRVDKDQLLVEGDVQFAMPEGMEALYADVRATRYQRSFSLSSELDPTRAEATLKEGVLTLRIPKRAQYQPRKIEVQAG